MQPSSGSWDFLALWEEGAGRHPLDRAVGLIAAIDGMSAADVADLPLDTRDRALYRAVARLFGDSISLVAQCPDCEAETELSFTVAEALAVPPPPERIVLQGGAAWCRTPTSRDLATALGARDPEVALLAALVDHPHDQAVDFPALRTEAETALADQAGLADLSLAHQCARCGAEGETPFDVLDYLWRRIMAESRRRLREVHVIASRYGWSSETVLALSPARRAAHIALIEG